QGVAHRPPRAPGRALVDRSLDAVRPHVRVLHHDRAARRPCQPVPYRQPLTPGPVGGGAGDDLPGREVLPPPAAYPGEDALASGLGPPGDDHADAALPPAVQPQLVVERLVEVLGPAADGLV